MKYKVKNLLRRRSIVHDNRHGTHNKRRRVENPRRDLGTVGSAASETKTSSSGLSQSSRSRPRRDERDPVRAPDRLPVERLERDGYLQQLIGSSTILGMDRSRSLPGLLGVWPARLRRSSGHRLVLALDGRGDDQGSAGRGKKPGPTPRTGRRGERSEACSPKPKASLSASWPMEPIGTTSNCLSRRSRAFLFLARSRRKTNLKGCAWTKDTTIPKSENSPASSVSRLISVLAARRRKRSRVKPDFVLDDGSWKGHIVG